MVVKTIFWICMLAVPFHVWGFIRADRQGNWKQAVGFLVMLIIVLVMGCACIWLMR